MQYPAPPNMFNQGPPNMFNPVPPNRKPRIWVIVLMTPIVGMLAFCAWTAYDAFVSREERADITPAKSRLELFTDDEPTSKKPVFDPTLIDSRLVPNGSGAPWQLNASAAVIRLDIGDCLPEKDDALTRLYPSYAAALKACPGAIPSINMIDAKAKQFDDGLYSALDLWTFQTQLGAPAEGLLRKLLPHVKPGSEAQDWLMAALRVGGLLRPDETISPHGGELVARFESAGGESKPVGFYTWSEDLKRAFHFLRFLQQPFPARAGAADDLAHGIAQDADLAKAYAGLLAFYAKLTDPFGALTLKDLADDPAKSLDELWRARGLAEAPSGHTVHFLPYSASREAELFNRLFGTAGLPEGAELMVEFVKAIRSGKVDLAPRANSGWADYQLYALETFLLPERGAEYAKLALTKRYKQRMLEAFAALVTKHLETHARQFSFSLLGGSAGPPSEHLKPVLRVEPNPTYFLRQARAYSFLQTFLQATVPAETWKALVGLREGGKRDKALAEELDWIKNVFYGLHLISCEDIGMKPGIIAGELAKPDDCYKAAADWLKGINTDADLGADTRFVVPIFVDASRNRTRNWGTFGVRGAKLNASYVVRPKWRPKPDADHVAAEWKDVETTDEANYVILTDEFGEFEREGTEPLTREEFRAICAKFSTKDEIIKSQAPKRP